MKLHDAMRNTIRKYGAAALGDKNLPVVLAGFSAFEEYPEERQVLEAMVSDGSGKKIAGLYLDHDAQGCFALARDIKKSLCRDRHFSEDLAGYAVDSIRYALGLQASVAEPSDLGSDPAGACGTLHGSAASVKDRGAEEKTRGSGSGPVSAETGGSEVKGQRSAGAGGWVAGVHAYERPVREAAEPQGCGYGLPGTGSAAPQRNAGAEVGSYGVEWPRQGGPAATGGADGSSGGGKTMFCEKCGAQIPADSEFCPKCGAHVGGPAGSYAAGADRNPVKKRAGCWIIAIIAPIVALLIFSVLALPAYSKSTARAKFTEVTTAAGPIKQQVELCFFDLGALKDAEPNPDTGATSCSSNTGARSRGTGWNLAKAVSEARSRYVFGAEVKNGVITMYSRNIKVNGQEVFTEILVPRIYGSDSAINWAINWEIAPESTCRQADLC